MIVIGIEFKLRGCGIVGNVREKKINFKEERFVGF